MFLSIIIPVYNAEKYLAECLDSCLQQDYQTDDYEIICINDGSKDGSLEILEKYASENKNLRVYTKENGGVSSARNFGIDHSKGDYIWFVDADDVIENDSVQILKKSVLDCGADRLRFNGFMFHDSERCDERVINADDNVVWLSLFSKHLIETFNLRFHTETAYGEDTLFILEYKLHSIHQIDLDEGLYCLRVHADSATKQMSIEKKEEMVRSYFYVGGVMKKLFEDNTSSSVGVRTIIADQMLMVMRKGLEILAQLPSHEQKGLLADLRSKGLYPVKMPVECTYTWKECVIEPSGTGKIRNYFRYYSIYPWGLFLAAVPFKLERIKIKVSRAARRNTTVNQLLDYKNKLLRK